jgi:hypothetical protein
LKGTALYKIERMAVLKLALGLSGLCLAAGHGQMMHPPNWFMTNGLPRVCPMMKGADWGIGAMWYTNYTRT